MSTSMPAPPKLLDRLRHACRVRHYSTRTEDAYPDWAKRFILFHRKRHPLDMAESGVNAVLTHLAVVGGVAASTQNQALAALLFLYGPVLGRPLDALTVVRAARPVRLPVVLSRGEVQAVLGRLTGVPRLVGLLLYGSGLRVLESVRLRAHDLDLTRNEVLVRAGKGNKDRRTVLPAALKAATTAAGLVKAVTPHTFWHAFATHPIEAGQDIRTVQALLGHASVETTMIYTHVLNRGGLGATSPADRL